jgi:uncharacterized RDD family membrane protein YckC
MTSREFHGRNAGIVTRAMAGVVDGLVVVLVLVVVWAGSTAVRFVARPTHFTAPSPSWAAIGGVSCVIAVFYLASSWATSGRTVGDQLLGLRVVGRAGGPVRWWASAVRAAAYVVLPIGLAWSIVDRQNRSVQDLVLGTRVTYDWVPRLPPTREDNLSRNG